jgi:hypothetical protein
VGRLTGIAFRNRKYFRTNCPSRATSGPLQILHATSRSTVSGAASALTRRVASLAVITKLVELGYLQPGARHRATAVERAVDRLRGDLIRQGVICDSNLSSSPKGEDQQGLLGTQIGERGP